MNYIFSLLIALGVVGSGYYILSVRPAQMRATEGAQATRTENYSSETLAQAVPNLPPQDTQASPSTTINTQSNIKIMNTVTFTTNKGVITIELDTVNTPKTAANFAELASKGFYDGIKFHRVIKGFMIQGGDPLTKDDTQMAAWGTGGPGYKFADEIQPATNKNEVGTLSMANSGPNTNGSQFFINVNNNNFLDTKHTVFGRVTSGMEVVKAIEAVATVPGDRPVDAVVIEKAVVSAK
jgi:cyclophilin family peptidyl-prolyl cis-trans isomerase